MQVDYGCHGYEQSLEFHAIDETSLSEAPPEVTELLFLLGGRVFGLFLGH